MFHSDTAWVLRHHRHCKCKTPENKLSISDIPSNYSSLILCFMFYDIPWTLRTFQLPKEMEYTRYGRNKVLMVNEGSSYDDFEMNNSYSHVTKITISKYIVLPGICWLHRRNNLPVRDTRNVVFVKELDRRQDNPYRRYRV